MHSSISSSEVEPSAPADARGQSLVALGSLRWVALLLATVCLFMIGVEAVTAYGFDRVSKIQRRVRAQYQAALAMRQTHGSGPVQVLILGNSLLGAGIDQSLLRSSLSPDIDVRFLVVESTMYFDWYYGLRRLLREGARPDVVVVALPLRHLTQNTVRGEYFAHYLMSTRDTLSVWHDLDLHPTDASGMLLGNLSAFYGVRAEIRTWVLAEILPELPQLMRLLTRSNPPKPGEKELRLLSPRLRAMDQVASAHGARLLVLPPPILDNSEAVLTHAGTRAGVPVVTLPDSETIGAGDLSDGFHLSEAGARKYTSALAPVLRDTIASTR